MRVLVTEQMRYAVSRQIRDYLKRLRLRKAERKLMQTQLEWEYWDRWRAEHKEED